MSRKLPFYIVDVFGEEKYSGNQLAVFTEAENIPSEEMASIARETNFSETTFVTDYNRDKLSADVRIFTPGGEIPFAGHPTLGTAYIVNKVFFENQTEQIKLNMKVGTIPVDQKDNQLWMTQVQPETGPELDKERMANALGLNIADIDNRFPILPFSTGMFFYIVPLKSLDKLINIKVNPIKILEELSDELTQQILVFAPEGQTSADTLSCRVFVPNMGIPEDPATGSANGCLAAYLVHQQYFGSTEIDVSVAQGYEMLRPSRLHLQAKLVNNTYDINVGGKVVDIARGEWE